MISILHLVSETSLQYMSAHKRLKRKNNDDTDDDDDQSVAEAAQLMSLLHRYARENLLLANIYIKVIKFFISINIF